MFLKGKNKVTDLWKERMDERTRSPEQVADDEGLSHSERKEISSPEQSRRKGNVTAWFDFYRQNLNVLTLFVILRLVLYARHNPVF